MREPGEHVFGPLGREAARRLPTWVDPLVKRARQWVRRQSESWTALDLHLARLQALGAVRAVANEWIEHEVYAAGQAGAGYPEIAAALHMTRQNARKRWPTAVNHRPGRQPRSRTRAG